MFLFKIKKYILYFEKPCSTKIKDCIHLHNFNPAATFLNILNNLAYSIIILTSLNYFVLIIFIIK